MSFGRFLRYKAVKWVGIVLMVLGTVTTILSFSIPGTGYGGYVRPSSGGPIVFLIGIVILIVGWLIMQYGTYKEQTTVITAGVKDAKEISKQT